MGDSEGVMKVPGEGEASPVAPERSAEAQAPRWTRRPLRRLALGAAVLALAALGVVAWRWIASARRAERRIAEADGYHAAGDHARAVLSYAWALDERAGGRRRQEILDRITRCIGEVENPAMLVEVALPVIERAPEVSFGKHDYLIARGIANRTIAMRPEGTNRTIAGVMLGAPSSAPRAEDRPILELARTRLDLFLNSTSGTSEEREAAQELRSHIQMTLDGKEILHGFVMAPQGLELPEGSADELRRRSEDAKLPPLDRAKAAFAAGQQREEQGEKTSALALYREAFEQVHRVLPFYGIDADEVQSDPDRGLLDAIAAAIRQLDPGAAPALSGGLRFHIEGTAIPPDWKIFF